MSLAPPSPRHRPGAPGNLLSCRRRRGKLLRLALLVVGVMGSMPAVAIKEPRSVVVGAEVLTAGKFAMLAGKRVGRIANQTCLAYGEHPAGLVTRPSGNKRS